MSITPNIMAYATERNLISDISQLAERSNTMGSKLYCVLLWLISLLVGAGIAALYLYLFISGYFPIVGVTVWIGVGVSAVLLTACLLRLLFQHTDEQHPMCRYRCNYALGIIIGAIATIGNGMMVLGGVLNTLAQSTQVLVYFTAIFFAFELIMVAVYASQRQR
jgi:hypothetical protein